MAKAPPPSLAELVARIHPGSEIVEVVALGSDSGATGGSTKGSGYAIPWRLTVRDAHGVTRRLVFRTATPNRFGHDRRADRAAELLLAFDTFGAIPRHVRALDVGVVVGGSRLVSLREGGEFWLVTDFADGRVYAEDLRRIVAAGAATPLDEERVRALAGYLATLHRSPPPEGDPAARYLRAVRDLVGHGEGIFGIVDGYPADTPGAPASRLDGIERRAVAYRARLRDRSSRLARTHGDFHPFNVLFGGGAEITLLDASRGGCGDPADDVVCMAINFPFFAIDRPSSWSGALRGLARRFLADYLARTGDEELLEVAPPFFAWRALVLANPRFYPALQPAARARILACAEAILDAGRLDLAALEGFFA